MPEKGHSHVQVLVRPATPYDAAAIAHVQMTAWRSAYRGIVADELLGSLSTDERTLRWTEILQQPEQATFVAEICDAGIVGFANGSPEREGRDGFQGELYALYILPEWQRQGIGTHVTAVSANWLFASRHDTMLVWVLGASPYRTFYERLGGVVVAKRDIQVGSHTLEAVAYGWDDLKKLVDTLRAS